ncbi:hypothetical protein FS837_010467 [Tulasnella sp. UAMH 9824]|nr:hypothetical protein FS837_010467 [Tulasnella sp. UAMH 9824]
MFAKFKSTRTPATAAAPAPQFEPGLNTPSASKKSSSFVKGLLRGKKTFHRSSAKKDGYSQDISQCRQGVPEPYQPFQGFTALACNNPAELDRPLYPRSPVEPTRSPASLSPSPRIQPGWRSSISSTAHRSNFSSTASPLLAPHQFATSATSFASTHSSPYFSKQPAAAHSATSLDALSLLAPLPSLTATLATDFVPSRSAFQYPALSATPRSKFAPKISSPLAQFVVTAPPTTFSPARSPLSTTSRATCPLDASPLFVPPQSFATTLAAKHYPAFSSFHCSNSTSNLSPSEQLIADLEETDVPLNRPYHAGVRGLHPMNRHRVSSHTKSRVYATEKVKEELDEVLKQVAAVDMECSKLEALLQDECDKFNEMEECSNTAQLQLEEADEEHIELQVKAYESQAGQATNGVWEHRVIEPLQRDSQPPQPFIEHAEKGRAASPAIVNWSQRAKKVLKSWASQSKSRVARQRSSVPRIIQTATKSDEEDRLSESDQGKGAKSAAPHPLQWMKHAPGLLVGANQNGSSASGPQGPVTARNSSKRQTKDGSNREGRRVETSYYNDETLRWGQLVQDSAVRARNYSTHSSRHA